MRKETVLRKLQERLPEDMPWILGNLQYLTIMGSHAYGLNTSNSDFDVYGFTIPPEKYLYPGRYGYISGFDEIPTFKVWNGSIKDGPTSEHLDWQIYNITHFIKLVSQNNPNMVDCLFTRDNLVLVTSYVARQIREQRKQFLHKGSWHRYKGYAYSQLNKVRTNPDDRESPGRKALIEQYGYDVKFALHIFRLLDEVDQILTIGDLDLLRNKEQHKAVRDGLYSLEQIQEYFIKRTEYLQQKYEESTLPYGPDMVWIKQLLVDSINSFFFNKS